MATPAAPAAPQVYTLPQQLLFTRQMVRFYESPAVPHLLKATVPEQHLFEARFILDQQRACFQLAQPESYKATRTEEDFPPSWLQLTTNDLLLLWQRFARFASSNSAKVPTWFPSRVIPGQGLNQVWAVDVFSHTGERYSINAPERRFALKVIDIAYCLISTPKSKAALRELLCQIVTNWNRLGHTHIYPSDPNDDLQAFQAIVGFLTKLRNNFPRVKLDTNSALGGSDAETTRRLWRQQGETMRDFDPNRACDVALNSPVVRSALSAARLALDVSTDHPLRRTALTNWTNFLFSMSIGMAHEYVHIFVGMLMGGLSPRTPFRVHWQVQDVEPNIGVPAFTDAEDDWIADPDWTQVPPGLENRASGESGFAWEGLVIGGKTKTDEDGRLMATEISSKYVEKFIECKFADSTVGLLPMNRNYLKKSSVAEEDLEGEDMMAIRAEVW
ncbi:hypothetical protein LCI18_002954 [Fusarium solani-melongenae]|uniref:Uncharacterized protein n=1 Tax=Fusarium solani subsp. cucurbitae TaxID=2747967 RepID=A0ACD3YSU7_FUSSC|nr:hypothetical protein LCI18_002954 [Fusarium solani-melongenae]